MKKGSLVYTNLKAKGAAATLEAHSTYIIYFWNAPDPTSFGARFSLVNTTQTQAQPVNFFVGYQNSTKTTDTKATTAAKALTTKWPAIALDDPKNNLVDLKSPNPEVDADNGLILRVYSPKAK